MSCFLSTLLSCYVAFNTFITVVFMPVSPTDNKLLKSENLLSFNFAFSVQAWCLEHNMCLINGINNHIDIFGQFHKNSLILATES